MDNIQTTDLMETAESLSQVGAIFLLQELGRRILATRDTESLLSQKKKGEGRASLLEDAQLIDSAMIAFCQMKQKKLGQQAEKLTHRELQILIFLAEGLSNREIAAKLDCKESTVKTHVERVAEKLGGLKNRTAIVAKAFRLGILV